MRAEPSRIDWHAYERSEEDLSPFLFQLYLLPHEDIVFTFTLGRHSKRHHLGNKEAISESESAGTSILDFLASRTLKINF